MKARRPDWIYDGSDIPDPLGHGERAVDFIKALKHPKSLLEGRAFDLPPFWERIVRRIYGPKDQHGARQVKVVFCLLPRGARKTTIGAALSLLHTYGYEKIAGGLALAAAAAEDQAGIAFEEAAGIVKATPWLAQAAKLKESTLEMEHPKSGSAFRAIPAKGDLQLGRTVSFCLSDELISWPSDSLWKALRTSLNKVPNSLLICITQAGRGQSNLAWRLYDYSLKVESGKIDDPGWLPVIFRADDDADWLSEEVWHTVNPGLALGFPDIGGLRQFAREAAERPAEREDFKQFHLNIWQAQNAAPFVEMSVWHEGGEPIDRAAFKGRRCWIAFDLGLTVDLSAVATAFYDDDESFTVLVDFFCPADNLQARADRDKVPYPMWESDGWLKATPGTVTDHRAIERHIRDLCEEFDVQEIVGDPAYAQAVMAPLTEDGFPTGTFAQNWRTMGPATREFERAIISRKLNHGGNPVLTWNIGNISVVNIDSAGNKAMHKGKSRDRIDGAVAAAMAVSRASSGKSTRSIYDSTERPDGLLFI